MNSTEKCTAMKVGERWLDTNNPGERTYMIQKVNHLEMTVTIRMEATDEVLCLQFYCFRDDHKIADAIENEYAEGVLIRQRCEVERLEKVIDEKVAEKKELSQSITKLRIARVLAKRMLEAGEKTQEDSNWI